MIQRHKRHPELFPLHRDALLPALGQCRKAIIHSHVKLTPRSPQYRAGGEVIAAIDSLATELTGDPRYFHIGSSTP